MIPKITDAKGLPMQKTKDQGMKVSSSIFVNQRKKINTQVF